MSDPLAKLEKINKEMKDKVATARKLIEEQQNLNMEKNTKLEELNEINNKLSLIDENQAILSSRNAVMREMFNQIDEKVKTEAEEVATRMKSFFRKLGLKVSLSARPLDSDNLIELKISFAENRDYNATFDYDTLTEDYDSKHRRCHRPGKQLTSFLLSVKSIEPENPNFCEIREFLRESGDIQGFLFGLRSKMLQSLMIAKENVQ